MYQYSAAQWLLFFLIYCFFGWCFESAYVSICQRKLVNRGFLTGPFLPIYGSGAIVILFAALPVRQSLILIFLVGAVAATALEFVTGALMETVLKVRYWDYSKNFCNVHGYICLKSTLAWGVLSILLVRVIHRPIERLILSLPAAAASILALIGTAGFAMDFAFSLKAALDLRALLVRLEDYGRRAREEARVLQRRAEIVSTIRRSELMEKLPDGGEALQRRLEAIEQRVAEAEQTEAVRRLREELAEWRIRRSAMRDSIRSHLTYDKRRLLRSHPTAVSRRYGEQMRLLREHYLQKTSHTDGDSPNGDPT